MATRFPRLSAAGTNPNCLDLPGVDRPFVHDAVDVLAGDVDVGDRVVVVGGGLVGAGVAIELAEAGKHVTIVEMLPQIMSDCAITDRVTFGERLEELGVEVHVDHIVTEIPKGSVVAVAATGRLLKPAADSVVMAAGCRPDRVLDEELRRTPALNVHDSRDCVRPRKISGSIHSGHRATLAAKTNLGTGLWEV